MKKVEIYVQCPLCGKTIEPMIEDDQPQSDIQRTCPESS
jgi:endogenous inhibitor of DNA gyrase (YacG/DUF329 family)